MLAPLVHVIVANIPKQRIRHSAQHLLMKSTANIIAIKKESYIAPPMNAKQGYETKTNQEIDQNAFYNNRIEIYKL